LNFVKTPKQRTYTKELEERAIEFHGHGGPFMIIGLKMGLHALEALDARCLPLTLSIYLMVRSQRLDPSPISPAKYMS